MKIPDPDVTILRNLRTRVPPPELHTRLRVIASRERQRRLASANWFSSWRDRAALFFDNVVKGFAVPAAGGVFAAILLFIMFVVPAYPLRGVTGIDVPTSLTTGVSLISMGAFGPTALGSSSTDLVVDVSVDEQGRMIDYVVVAGSALLASSDLRRRLGDALIVSRFAPATAFGQPMPSKVRLWFRSSAVDVRG